MSNNKEKKQWRAIGTVRKNDKGNVYLAFDKKVKITFDGQEVDLGEYGTVMLKPEAEMRASLDYLLENEYIDQATHEKRSNQIDEKNIRYELNVPLKK